LAAADVTDLRVGFIGLGVMGRPMARHILAAGFPLTVHSRSRGPVDELAAAGARPAASPADVGRASDVVVLMVSDPPDVEAVTFGTDGLESALARGSVIVDMSTGDPILARDWAARLGERGIDFLDAPVSGGMEAAIAGNLSVMVGGRAEALERARPVLDAVSSRIVHVGDSGAGQIVKAANQLVVGSTIQAVAEALLLAAAAGVDPVRVREALLGGYAASRVLEVHGQRMIDADFRPGARALLYRKDLTIILGLARALGVPTPAFDAVADGFRTLVERGDGDRDYSALVTLLEEQAGVRVAERAGAARAGGDRA
jgi:2-hydroxy-3-oxopropionate reductase